MQLHNSHSNIIITQVYVKYSNAFQQILGQFLSLENLLCYDNNRLIILQVTRLSCLLLLLLISSYYLFITVWYGTGSIFSFLCSKICVCNRTNTILIQKLIFIFEVRYQYRYRYDTEHCMFWQILVQYHTRTVPAPINRNFLPNIYVRSLPQLVRYQYSDTKNMWR